MKFFKFIVRVLLLTVLANSLILSPTYAVIVQGEESGGVYGNLKSTGGVLQIYNQTWVTGTNTTLLASAARTSTQTQADQTNILYHGVYVFCNVTVVPGIDTVQVSVQGKDNLSGVYYTIAASTATALTGFIIVKVSPYLATIAPTINGAVNNDYLPPIWRTVVTHSGAGSFTYGCSYALTSN